jgi:hypothetical protein
VSGGHTEDIYRLKEIHSDILNTLEERLKHKECAIRSPKVDCNCPSSSEKGGGISETLERKYSKGYR